MRKEHFLKMNYTRIFSDQNFSFGNQLNLSSEATMHMTKVLRKEKGSLVKLFDGKGTSCIAEIIFQKKNVLEVKVVQDKQFHPRQGTKIFLGLSLVKSNPFNFSIQKATELGVVLISPLNTERTVVKLKDSSLTTKHSRWKMIAIGACEQCGEDWLPKIDELQDFSSWCKSVQAKQKIVLYPEAQTKISDLSFGKSVAVALGPEGNFTKQEIVLFEENGFIPVTVGKRILRSETAVVSALSAIRTMCREF